MVGPDCPDCLQLAGEHNLADDLGHVLAHRLRLRAVGVHGLPGARLVRVGVRVRARARARARARVKGGGRGRGRVKGLGFRV